MNPVTFGDLLVRARGHLDAAVGLASTARRSESVVAAARLTGRLALSLSRYLDDIAPYSVAEVITRNDLERAARAAVDAREAMKIASECLRDGDGQHDVPAGGWPDSLTAHLAGAATSLAAGRDLLRTHFHTDPDGWPQRQDWAVVVTSASVSRALLAEAGAWSRQLALLTSGLSLLSAPDPAVPGSVHQGLGEAYHWLLTGSAAITAGQDKDPATAADIELMHAIPVSLAPVRQPPEGVETADDLARGVAVSAARLRMVAQTGAEDAAWSTVMTAESWRWTATGAGVICHLSELMLRSLAKSPGLAAGTPEATAQVSEAAEAVAKASARWREVAARWNSMTTETNGLTAPGIADTSDLILRLGRLVFADRGWGPVRARRAPLRAPADLAPDNAQAAVVAGAVHQAVDTLARMGTAELRAVETAIRADRIYVPTWSLPDYYDVPYKYGNATPAATAALLDAYRAACKATDHAVTGLDAVAVTINAPTRILAAARAATSPAPNTGERRAAGLPDPPGQRPAAAAPQPPADWPSSVERAVWNVGKPDMILLLRARAIDKLAAKLIDEAKQPSKDVDAAGRADGRGPSSALARNPARVAGENFPVGIRAVSTARRGAGPPVRSAAVSGRPQAIEQRRHR
jgi:hypothetical protein